MRLIPDSRFAGMPCSYTGTATAYEKTTGKVFAHPFPEGLKRDGWLTLNDENKYIRKYLSIRKSSISREESGLNSATFLKVTLKNAVYVFLDTFCMLTEKTTGHFSTMIMMM